jgi:hypothetical protein
MRETIDWKNACDSLPEIGQMVLVKDVSGEIFKAYRTQWEDGRLDWGIDCSNEVYTELAVHWWAELPKGPPTIVPRSIR